VKTLSIHVPEAYLRGIDKLVEKGIYTSRSEFIRAAIRKLLRREFWGTPSYPGKVYG